MGPQAQSLQRVEHIKEAHANFSGNEQDNDPLKEV